MPLPWARPFRKRCKARIPPKNKFDFYGRCELSPHGPEIEHALERGMVWVRWQDPLINYESPHYD